MLNSNKLGGNLASTAELIETEEPLVDDLTIQHIANQCFVYFASNGIDCDVNCNLSKSTVNCLKKFNGLQIHQFAQVFKAAKKKNPVILLYDKAMCDYDNLKAWLVVALKKSNNLKKKVYGSNVSNQKLVKNKQYHARGCFNTSIILLVKLSSVIKLKYV